MIITYIQFCFSSTRGGKFLTISGDNVSSSWIMVWSWLLICLFTRVVCPNSVLGVLSFNWIGSALPEEWFWLGKIWKAVLGRIIECTKQTFFFAFIDSYCQPLLWLTNLVNVSFSASHWLTFSWQVYIAIVVGQFSTTGVSSKIGVVTGTTTKIQTHIIPLARCYRVRNWQNPLKLVEMIRFGCLYHYTWALCKILYIFTFGVLGSAKDFTTASLPETSSCEFIPSFKEPSSSLSLRLLAFSCLPRQNGSSNLGNFFTRTVFSRFLPDLGVFLKKWEKIIDMWCFY